MITINWTIIKYLNETSGLLTNIHTYIGLACMLFANIFLTNGLKSQYFIVISAINFALATTQAQKEIIPWLILGATSVILARVLSISKERRQYQRKISMSQALEASTQSLDEGLVIITTDLKNIIYYNQYANKLLNFNTVDITFLNSIIVNESNLKDFALTNTKLSDFLSEVGSELKRNTIVRTHCSFNKFLNSPTNLHINIACVIFEHTKTYLLTICEDKPLHPNLHVELDREGNQGSEFERKDSLSGTSRSARLSHRKDSGGGSPLRPKRPTSKTSEKLSLTHSLSIQLQSIQQENKENKEPEIDYEEELEKFDITQLMWRSNGELEKKSAYTKEFT